MLPGDNCDNVIQAFPADAAQEPLADGIGFRSTVRRLEDFNSSALRDTGESCSVFMIAEEVPADAWRAPQPVVPSHLLNQGNRIGGQPRTAAMVGGLELPEESESLMMPRPESLRLEDGQGFFPTRQARRQEEKPAAVSRGQPGSLDLALQDD